MKFATRIELTAAIKLIKELELKVESLEKEVEEISKVVTDPKEIIDLTNIV